MPRLKHPMREMFAKYLTRASNASEAYRMMLPEVVGVLSPKEINRRAGTLKNHPDVKFRVAELLTEMTRETIATREQIAGALSSIVLARPAELLTEKGDIDMERLRQAGPELSGVEVETTYGAMGTTRKVKVKHRDAVAAAALLSKMQGWEAPQRVQVESCTLVALKDLRSSDDPVK